MPQPPEATAPQANGPTLDATQDNWMRGYLEGHETGATASRITTDTIRELEATAWDDGYDQGRHDGYQAAHAETADIITDLSTQHAEIDMAFRHFSHANREQRIQQRIQDMEASAARLHTELGTTGWAGLDNGAQLPSADWAPDTTKLRAEADRAIAAAPTPALTNWAAVRAYVDDRVWGRILGDLHPATRRQAIAQAGGAGTEAA